ncbi:MAG: thioredoxin [Planctomycetota bacterium]|jgi:thioredoxin 1|nr:thioredoxin [Planctomycetota bacterium]
MRKRFFKWLLAPLVCLVAAAYLIADKPKSGAPAPVETATAAKRTGGAPVRVLVAESFDAGIASGVHLVDFWAEWCGPCHVLAPTVEKLSVDYAGRATVSKLDIDAHPEVAERFAIAAIPTLIVFRDGKIVSRILGAVPEEKLTAAIDAALKLK